MTRRYRTRWAGRGSGAAPMHLTIMEEITAWVEQGALPEVNRVVTLAESG